MKLKFFAILALSGFAFVGCNSNKSEDGSLDSGRVDTSMSAPTTDTSSLSDTVPDTLATPIDSAR